MCPTEIRLADGHAASAPPPAQGLGEKIAALLLARSPLGPLVRWVAGIRASVHAKLLSAFMLVALLLVAMAAMSLETIARLSRQSQLLDQAHARVDSSREIQHALAMQMNFTGMALLLRDEGTIARILRENNRFNSTLERIEQAAAPEELEMIQRIRLAQDEILTIVADLANLIRDGKLAEAMTLHLTSGYPLYQRIEELVDQVVRTEKDKMQNLRSSAAGVHQRALVLMGGFAGGSILLALLLGFVISWSFILAVREADTYLSRVATGDFSTTIAVPNRDEFGALVTHMNQMTQQLHHLDEEQRQATQQLRTLNERLERASQAKSDFLASMSHELRTPMNAILGFTELLLDGVYGDLAPDLKQPIADVQTNGRHLLRLINDVLDLSKIEAGRMELNLAEYLVADIVTVVKASLRSIATEKELEFITSVPDEIPPAVGDGKRITQCLLNLTGNAMKFTPPRGHIEIRIELQGNTLLYCVSDTGIGIAPDQLENIFAEFRQADTTVAQEFGGTGLGLSITKKFVEMHDGRIWVESEPGKGSKFFFSIPLRVDGVRAG